MVGTRTLCPPCGLSTSLRAKRSNPFHSGARRKLDCFVASAFARRRASADKSAPRNDVITFRIQISNSRCASAFSRRHVARVLRECCPSKEEGAGNAGCALHPRSRVQNGQRKTHTSIQVQRRQSDIPCAMALRLIPRSPRRIGLCCLRRLRIAGSSAPGRADLPSADLTPTAEASGPHDFTVRFSTARQHVL